MSKLTYIVGDLFLSPGNTILVHACNTQGSWGAGIASAFRSKYPLQFQSYKRHCNERDSARLIGTCLLLPGNSEEEHDIACLFTSRAYGKRKDKPDVILENTRSAVLDLMRQNEKGKALNACRFNSGKFGVPWSDTESVLNELGVEMTVYCDEME